MGRISRAVVAAPVVIVVAVLAPVAGAQVLRVGT